MFRFWYRFVPENASAISRGATELAYNRIEPHLSDYMGRVFEDISSLVLKLTVGNKTVLMTGDASKAAWEWLVEKYPAVDGVSKLKSDILQVPHHGAKTAGTTAGYALVDPDVLVYPAGARLYERCVNPKYSNYQESTAVLISNTAKKHGDTTLDPTDLNALMETEYFFLAGEYLGTEQELASTRQCFIKVSEN